MPLFTLGSLVLDVPMGIVGVDYATGADFAVKPIVGAAQNREFMGEADSHVSITGQLLPHGHARNGMDGGIDELNTLNDMARTGDPYLLTRGDGTNFDYWFIEHLTKKGVKHDQNGLPRQMEVEIHLVKSPNGPSDSILQTVLNTIVGLFE